MTMPTRQEVDIAVKRRNTTAFIDENPVWVQFIRPVINDNNQGGKEQVDSITLLPQKVRLVPESIRNVSFGGLGSQAGPQTSVSVSMIAEWDADVQRGDYFTVPESNFVYSVVYMYDKFELPRLYETRAGLMERG
jgi:hypothetical protein